MPPLTPGRTDPKSETFEEYSAAYYMGVLYVEATPGEYAVMARDQHEAANRHIYTSGQGLERLDAPLVAKLDGTYFPIFASDDIPRDTLAVPDEILAASHVDNPPTLREVLVAKAERAAQYLEWFTPYSIASTTDA